MRCEHGWDAPQFCIRCVTAERDRLRTALEYVRQNELISDRGVDVVDKALGISDEKS